MLTSRSFVFSKLERLFFSLGPGHYPVLEIHYRIHWFGLKRNRKIIGFQHCPRCLYDGAIHSFRFPILLGYVRRWICHLDTLYHKEIFKFGIHVFQSIVSANSCHWTPEFIFDKRCKLAILLDDLIFRLQEVHAFLLRRVVHKHNEISRST